MYWTDRLHLFFSKGSAGRIVKLLYVKNDDIFNINSFDCAVHFCCLYAESLSTACSCFMSIKQKLANIFLLFTMSVFR